MLEIREFPDPILSQWCATIPDDSCQEYKKLADEMHETMAAADGIGLAAPQVGFSIRMFVMNVDKPLTIINPEILEETGRVAIQEGCLSFPGVQVMVGRAAIIRVKYQDIEGKVVETTFTGLNAICFQHEFDHLNGKTFLDYLSDFKRKALENRFKRVKNET